MQVVLAYKSFAANRAISHVGEDVRKFVESERLTPSRDRLWEIFCQEKRESLVKKQYQISSRRAAEGSERGTED